MQNSIMSLIRFARLKGFRRIAILNSTNASGQSSDAALKYSISRAENRQLQLVAFEHFNIADVSVTAQSEKVKAANPDVVITYAGGPGFITLLRGLRDAGVTVPIMTNASNLDPTYTRQYAALNPPRLYASSTSFAYYEKVGAPRGASRNAVNAFTDAYKVAGETLTQASSFVWDPLWIMVSGLRKLGTSATAMQLRDYILRLQGFGGVNGTYDFRTDDQHGLTDQSMAVVQWDPKTDNVVPASKPGGIPIEGL
jgi:branched-chain amino acid transport system substrate-binding protein